MEERKEPRSPNVQPQDSPDAPANQPVAAAEEVKEEPDYTTQAELDAFEKTVALQDPYLRVLNTQVGLSVQGFFDMFLGDNATHSLEKFYTSK